MDAINRQLQLTSYNQDTDTASFVVTNPKAVSKRDLAAAFLGGSNTSNNSAVTYTKNELEEVFLALESEATIMFLLGQNDESSTYLKLYGTLDVINAAATAAGTTSADGFAIVSQNTIFTTVASSTGAVLPVMTAGLVYRIVNAGANALQVYGNHGTNTDYIGTVIGSTGVAIAVGMSATFYTPMYKGSQYTTKGPVTNVSGQGWQQL